MEQVSEFVVAKRVIANVLNDAAAVSVGMSFLDRLLSSRWGALEERGANGGVPGDVDECFVRKHAVPEESRGRRQKNTDEKAPRCGYHSGRRILRDWSRGRELRRGMLSRAHEVS